MKEAYLSGPSITKRHPTKHDLWAAEYDPRTTRADRRALWYVASIAEQREAPFVNYNLFFPNTPSAEQNGHHPVRRQLLEIRNNPIMPPAEKMLARFAIASANPDTKSCDLIFMKNNGFRHMTDEADAGAQMICEQLARDPSLHYDIIDRAEAHPRSLIEMGLIPGDDQRIAFFRERLLAVSEPHIIEMFNTEAGEMVQHEATKKLYKRSHFVLNLRRLRYFSPEFAREVDAIVQNACEFRDTYGYEVAQHRTYELSREVEAESAHLVDDGNPYVLFSAATAYPYINSINDKSDIAHQREIKTSNFWANYFEEIEPTHPAETLLAFDLRGQPPILRAEQQQTPQLQPRR